MNATAPPKPATIRATPLNVEESRAQRLQRQQARFRDRGGIFVPTNRSTLLDILLGKASPLKKPRRSASASPSRAVAKGKYSTSNEASKPALRRSPRKQPQKTVGVATDDQPMTDDPLTESEASKPIKNATASKDLKSHPQKKEMVPPKRTTKSGTEIQKANKKTAGGSENEASTKRIIPNADDGEDDVPLTKSKPKGKKASATKTQGEVDAKSTSKTRATISSAAIDSSQIKQAEKAGFVCSELSDDDACKPTKRAYAKKVKKSAPLQKATSKTWSTQRGKGASKVNKLAPAQLPHAEDEECNTRREDTDPPASSSNVVVASSNKKRVSASITQDSEPQPRRKRVKSGTIQPDGVDPSLQTKSNLSGEEPLVTSKKRRRNQEHSESVVDVTTKRKKHSSQSESKQTPEIPVEEEDVKPFAKRSKKINVTKPVPKSKKQSSDNANTASKRKENAPRSNPSKAKVKSKSGPPKSVLQRIKDSLGAQVVDNEPDPIDFLS